MKKKNHYNKPKTQAVKPPAAFNDDSKSNDIAKVAQKSISTGKSLDYLSLNDFREIAEESKGNIYSISKALNCSYHTIDAKIKNTPDWEDVLLQAKKNRIEWVMSKHDELIEGIKATDMMGNVYERPPSMKAIEIEYKKLGLLVDKTENKNSNLNMDVSEKYNNLSDDEIKDKLNQFLD